VPATLHVLVGYLPTATKGVYQSTDAGTQGHSWSASPGRVGKPLDGGDWMLRAVGTAKPPKIEQPDPDAAGASWLPGFPRQDPIRRLSV